MPIYDVDVFPYPKKYRIEAPSKADAETEARQLFNIDTDGASIYEISSEEDKD